MIAISKKIVAVQCDFVQALNNLKNLGGYDAYDKVMDAILSRLNGESDGYIH